VIKSRFLAALIAVVAACSMAPAGGGSGSRDRLTQEELSGPTAGNVYEVVQELRPDWLTARGPTGFGRPDASGIVPDTMMSLPNVYMSGSIVGSADFLKQLDVAAVQELIYHDAARAAARFGMNNPRGVIEVILRSPDPHAAGAAARTEARSGPAGSVRPDPAVGHRASTDDQRRSPASPVGRPSSSRIRSTSG